MNIQALGYFPYIVMKFISILHTSSISREYFLAILHIIKYCYCFIVLLACHFQYYCRYITYIRTHTSSVFSLQLVCRQAMNLWLIQFMRSFHTNMWDLRSSGIVLFSVKFFQQLISLCLANTLYNTLWLEQCLYFHMKVYKQLIIPS